MMFAVSISPFARIPKYADALVSAAHAPPAPMTRTIDMLNHALRLTLASCAILVLAGCSNEPSDGDIKTALEAEFDGAKRQMKELGMTDEIAQSMMPEIHNVKVLDCEETGEKAYLCNFEIDISMPMGERKTEVDRATFVKREDGTWAPQ